MSNLNRRELLQTGLAMAPLAGLSLMWNDSSQSNNKDEQQKKGKQMKIKYLEIVTPEDETLCKLYSTIHGVEFGDPVPSFGNARTAKLDGGGMIGIRKPMHAQEKSVTRTYTHTDDLKKAMAAAKAAGAEIAIESMDMPGGEGKIGIFIHGGIECGLWQT